MSHDDPSVTPLLPGPLVLVVAQDQTPRVLVSQAVRALGYQTRSCSRSGDALWFLQTHPGAVRLLLTDLALPEMDGGELAERARDLDPGLDVVLMLPRNDPRWDELRAGYHDWPCLATPFRFEDLAEALGELLGTMSSPVIDPPSMASRRPRRRSGHHQV